MKLFYRERGTGDPVIVLHGLWGASENWLPVANRLSDRFRMILPDARNHGRSPRSTRMDYEAMSDDVVELVETLALPARPAVVGHSLGGKVVMTLLLGRPGVVSRGVVVDAAPLPCPPGEHARVMALMERLSPSRFPTRAALAAAIDALRLDEGTRQLLRKNTRAGEHGPGWNVNLAAIRANLDALLDFPRDLPLPRCEEEVLFIKGERSGYIPGAAALLPAFPAARLVQIPGCGHRIHEERPDELARITRAFLEGNLPGAF
jgi:pimeloyl-ACP methyl ester carboxylesterase